MKRDFWNKHFSKIKALRLNYTSNVLILKVKTIKEDFGYFGLDTNFLLSVFLSVCIYMPAP